MRQDWWESSWRSERSRTHRALLSSRGRDSTCERRGPLREQHHEATPVYEGEPWLAEGNPVGNQDAGAGLLTMLEPDANHNWPFFLALFWSRSTTARLSSTPSRQVFQGIALREWGSSRSTMLAPVKNLFQLCPSPRCWIGACSSQFPQASLITCIWSGFHISMVICVVWHNIICRHYHLDCDPDWYYAELVCLSLGFVVWSHSNIVNRRQVIISQAPIYISCKLLCPSRQRNFHFSLCENLTSRSIAEVISGDKKPMNINSICMPYVYICWDIELYIYLLVMIYIVHIYNQSIYNELWVQFCLWILRFLFKK